MRDGDVVEERSGGAGAQRRHRLPRVVQSGVDDVDVRQHGRRLVDEDVVGLDASQRRVVELEAPPVVGGWTVGREAVAVKVNRLLLHCTRDTAIHVL